MTAFLKHLKLWLSVPKLAWQADPVRYYEYLGDDVVEGEGSRPETLDRPLWLNLGYWQTARTYPEAASAMARLVAEAAQLSADDRLLDVGFGFAEQDFFWLEHFGVKSITGLNITPMQVERATQRAAQRGLEARLDLRVGSATDVPFSAASFDKVTALECAHHFDTREQFFREAFRVLRPGGRLALSDGLPLPGHKPLNLATRLVLRRWASPTTNYYDRHVYQRKLEAIGFVDVQCRPIGNQVFAATLRYAALRRSGQSIEAAVVEALTPEQVEEGLKQWAPLGLNDYLIVSARKPD